MGFDVFLQSFDGNAVADVQRLRAYLEPLLDRQHFHVITSDGRAEVYGLDRLADGLMLTHLDGSAIWDVIYTLATTARWVIMPVGCPVCLINPDQADTLPPELVDAVGYRVVRSGADIERAVDGTG